MGKNLQFQLEGHPHVELKNLLKLCNLCDSGGAAKAAIEQGEVVVDGSVETRKACKIKAGQTVVFQETSIQVES